MLLIIPADFGAVITSLAMTSALFGLSFPSKPTINLYVWCGLIISLCLLTWNNGLSIANEKVNGIEKTFLKDIVVLPLAFIENGPCGFGGKQLPFNGIIYSPPIGDASIKFVFVSTKLHGS